MSETPKGLVHIPSGTVGELISVLDKMPLDATVYVVWDGHPRTVVYFAWAKGKQVCLTDYGAVVYNDEWRPEGAPTEAEDRYWQTPEDPSER